MPQTNIRFEPIGARLSKLQNSREYQDAFTKLKQEILAKDEDNPPSKIESVNIAKKVGEKYKRKGFSAYDVSLIEKSIQSSLEDKIREDRRRSSFFSLSRDMIGSHCKHIPPEQIKKILSKGNINRHRILIPEIYSDFKDRWRLICFFDPNFTIGFDPFFREPQVISWVRIPHGDQPYILDLRCDIRWPLSLLVRRFEEETRFIKSAHKLKERRAGRYPEEEISGVKKLINDGRTAMEIFRIQHPQHRTFNYMRDYVGNPCPTRKKLEAARLYKRIQRLVKAAKEQGKTG